MHLVSLPSDGEGGITLIKGPPGTGVRTSRKYFFGYLHYFSPDVEQKTTTLVAVLNSLHIVRLLLGGNFCYLLVIMRHLTVEVQTEAIQ